MSDKGDQDDKEFDPSAHRLQKAREEGDVIRSEELQAAVAVAALALAFAVFGPAIIQRVGALGVSFLERPEHLTLSTQAVLTPAVQMVLPAVALLLAPAAAVLLWLIASRAMVFAPSKLALKWSRLSPLSNAKQKYGASGLVDFLRRSLKLLAVGAILVLFLRHIAGDLFLSLRLEPGQILLLMGDRLMGFLWLVAAIGAVFGLVDLLWQRHQFLQRNRMSRKELTDEMKDSEGDPQQKADRRRRAQEVANRKMLVDVPKADVVIVNPTHYAVALKWERKKGGAPVCVAKGVDEMAAKIRELAGVAGVPIHRDPPTARLLHAALSPGQEIRREHFTAVAAAIRFADAMRAKAAKAGAGWR